MSIDDLEKQVIEWANRRDLYQQSTDMTRLDKFAEEIEELIDEMFPTTGCVRDLGRIRLEAGDVLVTLINLLHPLGLDLETCLAAAYEKIKGRTGKMVGGTFVKSEDLP